MSRFKDSLQSAMFGLACQVAYAIEDTKPIRDAAAKRAVDAILSIPRPYKGLNYAEIKEDAIVLSAVFGASLLMTIKGITSIRHDQHFMANLVGSAIGGSISVASLLSLVLHGHERLSIELDAQKWAARHRQTDYSSLFDRLDDIRARATADGFATKTN